MSFADSLYEKLTDDEDARACDDISDDACRETPNSFTLILLSNFLTKLGDALASPKTTLAWVTNVVGAPAFVLGLLVPIRESGSLMPQLFIGSAIRGLAVRKWVWVAGSIVQSIAISGIGAVVWLLDGAAAGWAILALITIFSLARGFCSVASKDVLGKTVPKRRRGRLNGWSASAAGLVSLGAAGLLMLPQAGENGETLYGAMIAGAGLLWLFAAAIYSRIDEFPGETGGGRSAADAFSRLRVLLGDQPFRRFVVTRALLLSSALSAPFYVSLAQQRLGSPGYLLGMFVAANGLASLVSAPLWGRFADRSSKGVMIAAALLTAATGAVTVGIDLLAPDVAAMAWLLPCAYLLLSIAHAGVRIGRKTYVVDLASGNRRTDYVSISNTVIGVMLLVLGAAGALAQAATNTGMIAIFAAMALAAAVLGLALR
jgi:hypothetical protein